LEVSGGKAPYEIEWSNFATGLNQQNVSPGTYIAKITDANKCDKSIVVKVEDNSQFTILPTVRQITCNGANNGSIKIEIKSNRTGIKLKWLDGSKAGNERNNLAPGVYVVEVSDGGPCVLTNTYVISEPAKLSVSSKIKNAFGCDASNSGAIEINVVGGTAPYNYLWSNGEKLNKISNLLPGKYFVTVTDSLGCSTTEAFELLRHDPIKINVSTKIAYCNINLKYKEICTATINGGLAPFKYNWSSGTACAADSSAMETFANQTVALEVIDALGCGATYYFKTDIPESNIETAVVDCNGQVYKFDIKTPPTVFTNVMYDWNFGDGTSSNIKSPTHIFMKSGDYVVKLKITSNEAVLNFETTMTVEALPQLKLDREPRFCKNDSVELIVSGADSYIWNDGTRGNRKVIKNEGNYTVLGISANGCSSTLAFTAKYYDYQNYSIFTDKNVLTLNDPTLKVWSEDVNLTNYQWEFGDNGNDEGNFVNHTYDINSPITVKVKLNVVNPYGCVETAEKVVWLIMESIPNTFTPNSDGANDRFLKGTKMQVFNSNGIIIYEGTEGWDGTYKGKPVGMDTYYYVVYYSTPEGIVNKPGFVFLAK
jgi:gliding motility-associated-like protein